MRLAYLLEFDQKSQEVVLDARSIIISGYCLLDIINLTFLDSEEVDTWSCAPQLATRSGVLVQRLIFDLIVETEHYIIYSNVLS
jgi:hypothetical protein